MISHSLDDKTCLKWKRQNSEKLKGKTLTLEEKKNLEKLKHFSDFTTLGWRGHELRPSLKTNEAGQLYFLRFF